MTEQLTTETKPPLQHLAIIMDGNGRWAKQRELPRIAGHQKGVESVLRVVDECLRLDIRYLSLFAFSSENWGRPQQEVEALMTLLLQFLAAQRQKMLDNGIRLKVIGDRSPLSNKVREALDRVEAETAAGWLFPVGDEVVELGYVDMFDDMFEAIDGGRVARETFYDGYVVNAVMDAAYRSARSGAWTPVELYEWRGGTTPRIATTPEMHEGKVVIKREVLPDGRHKLVLKDPATGDFSDRVVGDA